MKIRINNPSSPGAMYSDNTNEALIGAFDWIEDNGFPTIGFKQLREKLVSEKGINDNNARNIFPLARACGFVSYKKNSPIDTNLFFTKRGNAYIQLLKTKKLISGDDNYSGDQKKSASKSINSIISNIIYDGLRDLLLLDESNYKSTLKDIINYLLRFGKINKEEYALMLYGRNNYNDSFLDDISELVVNYRNHQLDLEIEVEVRDDMATNDSADKTTRVEGIGYLSSYTYFVGLLSEANLITDIQDNYYFVVENNAHKLEDLMED